MTVSSSPHSDEAERLRYNLTSLSEIGRIFASEANFQNASETALRSILGAVAISSGALFTYAPQTQSLVCTVSRGLSHSPDDIPATGNVKRLLLKARNPLILSELSRWPKTLQAIKDYLCPMAPHVWVPLVMQNELQGVLSLGSKFLNEAYRPEDLHLLDTIGHHFAVGLYNQRLLTDGRDANFQLNRKVVELETLYDAGLALSSSLKVDNVVEEVLLLSVGVIDARAGCLFVRNEKTGRLTLIHQVGLSSDQVERLRASTMRRHLNQALRTQKTFSSKPGTLPKELEITHCLVAPVGQAGILAVFDKESRQGIIPFTEDDTRLLELMGQQAGAALANARLYDSILEVKNYNQNILESIGNGVISTDLNGKIVQINASIERVFGTQTVPLGQSCARFFERTQCHDLAKAIRATLKDGQSRQVDGEYAPEHDITLDARIAALRSEQNDIQGVVIALEDLTEKERIRDRFKQYANRETGDELGMGLGLARGNVIAGNIGSLRRLEYTVIGESVNVASRLCDGARTGQIWAGSNIHDELKNTFEFQHLGRKRFKGFDPIEKKIVDLTIPMLPEMELAATKTAEGVAQFMGLSEDKLEETKMALIEACINAFEHSQSKDAQITINFAIGEEDLTIQISDTGQGFDPDFARKKVVERRERGESKRGWGLTIMSELMDHVAIQSDENGTVITMIKQR